MSDIRTSNPTPTMTIGTTPIALAAGITVEAVDQIGETAAREIEGAADALEERAGEIAAGLRKLAAAVREHSRDAAASVEEFCNRSTDVVATIRSLQERLDAGQEKRNGNTNA
jgi:hypothetical protein